VTAPSTEASRLAAYVAARDYQFNSAIVNFRFPEALEAELWLACGLFSDTIDRLISVLYLPLPGIRMTPELGAQEPVISFALRPACAGDEAFLFELYCTTRNEEIAAWGLDSSQQEILLRMQFNAQRQHYELAYGAREHSIIMVGNRPTGRIMVFRSEQEFVLVDIALLPDARGMGIGAALIADLLTEAERAGKPVSLHVAKDNRARRLYERLGFEICEDTGMYFKMEWRARRV
jgi:ribosomal protein S18 acetylase RimI-like enzyme